MPPDQRRVHRKADSFSLACLLGIVFVIALGLLLWCLNVVFSNYAVKQIDARATFVMDTMNADYSYREAALNPTNPKDRADAAEAAIIRAFRADADLTELEGIRQAAAGPTHYIARPIRVSEQKCLGCHATPQGAPASLVATYGSANGFGWRLGEVVGAQIVTVPTGTIHRAKWDALGLTAVLNTSAFLATASVLLLFLSRAIVGPMRTICARAFEASIHPERVDFSEKRREDEIGLLAQSFDRLKQSLLIAMQMLQQPPDGRPPD